MSARVYARGVDAKSRDEKQREGGREGEKERKLWDGSIVDAITTLLCV